MKIVIALVFVSMISSLSLACVDLRAYYVEQGVRPMLLSIEQRSCKYVSIIETEYLGYPDPQNFITDGVERVAVVEGHTQVLVKAYYLNENRLIVEKRRVSNDANGAVREESFYGLNYFRSESDRRTLIVDQYTREGIWKTQVFKTL